MKKYPATRVRALAARFGSKVLASYLGAAPSLIERLKRTGAEAKSREAKALAKLARHGTSERKLLRLDAADLATRAGVSVATAKGWKKRGAMGSSPKARALLLTSHVTGTKGAEPGMKKPGTHEESYIGHTTRGRTWVAMLSAPVLLTGSSIATVAGWLRAIQIPSRWRGRGSSYLITGIADCRLTEEQVGPGSRGTVIRVKRTRNIKLENFVLSSGKQSKFDVAIREFLSECHDATQYETTLKQLEVKVYRDR